MSKKTWVKTAVAASDLGISVDYLLELRQTEMMQPGIHWKDISRLGSMRPTYRWHSEHLSKLFEARSNRAQ